MTLKKEGLAAKIEAIWFYMKDDITLKINATIKIIYQLDSQTYLGNQKLQLIVVHVEV